MSGNIDSLPPKSIDAIALASVGRVQESKRLHQARVTRFLLAMTFVIACVVGTGLTLRLAVSMFGKTEVKANDIDGVRPVSKSLRKKRSEREVDNEQVREQARSFDKRLLERRRDREWIYQTRDLPDASDSRRAWQREVDSIEKQLAEAKLVEERIRLETEDPTFEIIAENSVLWHQMKSLEKLREDAPADN